VGQSLKRAGFQMDRLLCSQLKRTHDYAKTLAMELGAPREPKVRADLNEIDYGSWGGLSTDEILSKDPRAKEALERWEKESVWPELSPWKPGAQELSARVKDLAEELAREGAGDSVIVSSNGVLRYFLKLIDGEWERRVGIRDFKMKTGHCGLIEYDKGAWKVLGWNLSPAELEGTLKR